MHRKHTQWKTNDISDKSLFTLVRLQGLGGVSRCLIYSISVILTATWKYRNRNGWQLECDQSWFNCLQYILLLWVIVCLTCASVMDELTLRLDVAKVIATGIQYNKETKTTKDFNNSVLQLGLWHHVAECVHHDLCLAIIHDIKNLNGYTGDTAVISVLEWLSS